MTRRAILQFPRERNPHLDPSSCSLNMQCEYENSWEEQIMKGLTFDFIFCSCKCPIPEILLCGTDQVHHTLLRAWECCDDFDTSSSEFDSVDLCSSSFSINDISASDQICVLATKTCLEDNCTGKGLLVNQVHEPLGIFQEMAIQPTVIQSRPAWLAAEEDSNHMPSDFGNDGLHHKNYSHGDLSWKEENPADDCEPMRQKKRRFRYSCNRAAFIRENILMLFVAGSSTSGM